MKLDRGPWIEDEAAGALIRIGNATPAREELEGVAGPEGPRGVPTGPRGEGSGGEGAGVDIAGRDTTGGDSGGPRGER